MLKSLFLLFVLVTLSQSAHADVKPLNFLSDYNALVCVNPVGEENSYEFVKYIKRYRADGLFTYLEFNDGVFDIKNLSIENSNLILKFSAARVGQMSNDERLQERVIVNPATASAKRVQDINGKVSMRYPFCKLFPSEDLSPMIKWVRSLKPIN